MDFHDMIEIQEKTLAIYMPADEVHSSIMTAEIMATQLMDENTSFESEIAETTLQKTITAMAFYMSLKDSLGSEIACLCAQDVVCTIDDALSQKGEGIYSLSKWTMKKIMNETNTKDEGSGLKLSVIDDVENGIHFRVSKCPLYTLLNKYHLTQLGTYLCYGNEHVGLNHRSLSVEIPQKMTKGDMYCEYIMKAK